MFMPNVLNMARFGMVFELGLVIDSYLDNPIIFTVAAQDCGLAITLTRDHTSGSKFSLQAFIIFVLCSKAQPCLIMAAYET
uniref:Secreted protein n=1 Tax=Angiostrongylus cantonensis TaxID=6313 RepID=A0A0K0DDE5_ANGCA